MKLGDRVTFTTALRRTHRAIPGTFGCDEKLWVPNPYYRGPKLGVLVGLRTLFDGIRNWSCGGDDPTTFTPKRTIKAALVATSLRAKPVLVALEEVEVIHAS